MRRQSGANLETHTCNRGRRPTWIQRQSRTQLGENDISMVKTANSATKIRSTIHFNKWRSGKKSADQLSSGADSAKHGRSGGCHIEWKVSGSGCECVVQREVLVDDEILHLGTIDKNFIDEFTSVIMPSSERQQNACCAGNRNRRLWKNFHDERFWASRFFRKSPGC